MNLCLDEVSIPVPTECLRKTLKSNLCMRTAFSSVFSATSEILINHEWGLEAVLQLHLILFIYEMSMKSPTWNAFLWNVLTPKSLNSGITNHQDGFQNFSSEIINLLNKYLNNIWFHTSKKSQITYWPSQLK